MEIIHLVGEFATQKGWAIYQLDVKSTFLHGELNQTVYVDQPYGYVKKCNEYKVYKLKRLFPMRNIISMRYFLGLEMMQQSYDVFLC